jgi:two-component system nitrogen regulation response regulator NtrX
LLLLATGGQVDGDTVETALPGNAGSGLSTSFSSGALSERVDAFEREVILGELKRAHSNVSLAAKSLGLERSHLYKKAEQLGIDLKSVRREQGPVQE